MRPLLVTSVENPLPHTPPALPGIVPRVSRSRINSIFLPFADWEEGGEYDVEPPRYVSYTIEWKLILNRKAVGRVTDEDLVVAPSEYWEETLKAAVEDMLRMKK